MKKVVLTVASILLAGILTAQEYAPPPAAVSALKTKYPTAVADEWYDNEDEIICYFDNNGQYGSVYFTPKGVWKKSEYSINEDELPKAVSASLQDKYSGYDITDVTKIESTKTLYKIYVFNPITESDFLLTLDESGKFISEEDLNADDSFE